jgi:hypothetical protein
MGNLSSLSLSCLGPLLSLLPNIFLGFSIVENKRTVGSSSSPVNPKIFKIVMCWFSAKLAALRRNIKDCLAWNQDIVSEWTDRLLFQ